jgi:hypothetical protein
VDIEAGLNASVELGTYFQEQVDQRRSAMTNDIIGDLVGAEIDGEKLTDEAIISFLRLLLPAGLETMRRCFFIPITGIIPPAAPYGNSHCHGPAALGNARPLI